MAGRKRGTISEGPHDMLASVNALLWVRRIDLGVVNKGIAEYELFGLIIGGKTRID